MTSIIDIVFLILFLGTNILFVYSEDFNDHFKNRIQNLVDLDLKIHNILDVGANIGKDISFLYFL
jgi:hypothetical protein